MLLLQRRHPVHHEHGHIRGVPHQRLLGGLQSYQAPPKLKGRLDLDGLRWTKADMVTKIAHTRLTELFESTETTKNIVGKLQNVCALRASPQDDGKEFLIAE